MLAVEQGSAAVAQRSLGVQILGGVLDFIHVSVEGIAGTGDLEAGAKALLETMQVDGVLLSKDGSTSPVISGMTGEAFRQIANVLGGYIQAQDGFIIATGRQEFGPDAGISLRLKWDVPTVPNVDFSGASVVVRRAALAYDFEPEPLAIYEGQPVTDTAQRFSTTVPGLIRAFYLGAGLTKVTLDLAGSSYTLDASFLKAISSATYRHEQAGGVGALVLYDADRTNRSNPRFTLYSDGSGLFVQHGHLVK